MEKQRIYNKNDLNNSSKQEDETKELNYFDSSWREFRFGCNFLQSPRFFKFFKFTWTIFFVFISLNCSGKNNGIHRECFRTKMCIKEMDRENKSNS